MAQTCGKRETHTQKGEINQLATHTQKGEINQLDASLKSIITAAT